MRDIVGNQRIQSAGSVYSRHEPDLIPVAKVIWRTLWSRAKIDDGIQVAEYQMIGVIELEEAEEQATEGLCQLG